MPLTAGTRLGPYEIVSAIGAGGMGEVYRARDLRLDRTIALKVLPELFTSDPERLVRFEREAKSVEALTAMVGRAVAVESDPDLARGDVEVQLQRETR